MSMDDLVYVRDELICLFYVQSFRNQHGHMLELLPKVPNLEELKKLCKDTPVAIYQTALYGQVVSEYLSKHQLPEDLVQFILQLTDHEKSEPICKWQSPGTQSVCQNHLVGLPSYATEFLDWSSLAVSKADIDVEKLQPIEQRALDLNEQYAKAKEEFLRFRGDIPAGKDDLNLDAILKFDADGTLYIELSEVRSFTEIDVDDHDIIFFSRIDVHPNSIFNLFHKLINNVESLSIFDGLLTQNSTFL